MSDLFRHNIFWYKDKVSLIDLRADAFRGERILTSFNKGEISVILNFWKNMGYNSSGPGAFNGLKFLMALLI